MSDASDVGPTGIASRRSLAALDRADCLALLAAGHLGRVIVVRNGRPDVFPVNYVLDGETVVFQTGVGTKLTAATYGDDVAFEVDAADPMYHTGWSVVARGVASLVVDPTELDRMRRLPLRMWVPEDRVAFVRIVVGEMSGRRIVS